MLNIEQMSKQLTHDEYEQGRNVFNISREQGFPASKSAGIVYRAGRLQGKKDAKDNEHRFRAEIGRLHGIIRELKASAGETDDLTLQEESMEEISDE